MNLRQGTLTLVRHTLSARLFGRELLAAHLAFCGQAARRTPVWRLPYAHSADGIEAAGLALKSVAAGNGW
jgi:hypothetical protein